ncbi:MAG: imidazoleglycerol-phosphate dehydratase HisB [Clostridia bacterium]|nr:imidazoleglycerol-phosphate dehydratase HisB [Clostridia bacterium]
MRNAEIERNTAETKIKLALELDGKGKNSVDTGCGFLDHMLTLFSAHGKFGLDIVCKGDTEVDYHHTAEDIGIALGQAFASALGDKKGITRYGQSLLPMDEALVMTAADISGRGFLGFQVDIPTEKVGDFDTELVKEFWLAFTRVSGITLHFVLISGENSHHIIEACFKSAARSLRAAVASDPGFENEVPSTKGVL